MKTVHLVILDLFLPKSIAAEVVAGLSLPALQKMLGRGRSEMLEPVSIEELLCRLFEISFQGDAPIATISASFDGLAAGCWLRADPVHLNLQRDQLLLAGVQVDSAEAAALCANLNEHFSDQGMEFFAPHPQRWYVRLDTLPRIRTTPLSNVIGSDVRRALPTGEDSARWHQLFNEIQMLLFAHPLNATREARGELMINSVWFWGGGCDTLLAKPADCGNSRQAAPTMLVEDTVESWGGAGPVGALKKSYARASSDEDLVEMFATAADIPFETLPNVWNKEICDGEQLMVWTGLRSALRRGDLATWRDAMQEFEAGYAQPLWQALRNGKLDLLEIDIACDDGIRHLSLKRGDTWAFWRRSRNLAEYSLV